MGPRADWFPTSHPGYRDAYGRLSNTAETGLGWENSLFYSRLLVYLRFGGQSASALRPAGDICAAENANTPWIT